MLAAKDEAMGESENRMRGLPVINGHAKHEDPVCGMLVDQQKPAAKAEYNGKTYYFCSKDHKEMFDAQPARYIEAADKR